jgi:hypothetical protein
MTSKLLAPNLNPVLFLSAGLALTLIGCVSSGHTVVADSPRRGASPIVTIISIVRITIFIIAKCVAVIITKSAAYG